MVEVSAGARIYELEQSAQIYQSGLQAGANVPLFKGDEKGADPTRRIDLMAVLIENVGDTPPAPTAMPGAVDKHECLARGCLRHRLCPSERRGGDHRRTERCATRDRMVRHRILPAWLVAGIIAAIALR